MKNNKLSLKITAPDGIFLEGEINEIVVPGKEGYFGVREGHTPIISTIIPGTLSIFEANKEKIYIIHNGFAIVADNVIDILTETIENPKDIDIGRAKQARERAKKRLKEKKEETNLRRAEAALRRALARLSVANK